MPSSVLYANGSDWSVFIDWKTVACSLTLEYDQKGLIFISGGSLPDTISFVDERVMPTRETYKFELRDETGAGISVEAQAREAGGYGYWQINGLSKGTVSRFIRGRALYVNSDMFRPVRYDLRPFSKGVRRFSDCMKTLESKKTPRPSSPPTTRRMN